MDNTQLHEQLSKVIEDVTKQIKQAHEAEIYHTGRIDAYRDVLNSLQAEPQVIEQEPIPVKKEKK